MMAISCFVRGTSVSQGFRPKKLAAPMYFDFGWQIYNSVDLTMIGAEFSVDHRWIWQHLRMILTRSVVVIRDYMSDIGPN